MKYNGTIEIKPNFFLTNPTITVKGIFEAKDENDVFMFKYIEIHFVEENKNLTHSRYWEVDFDTYDNLDIEQFIATELEKLKL